MVHSLKMFALQVKFLSTVLAQKASAATQTLGQPPPGLVASALSMDKLAKLSGGSNGSVGTSRSMTNLSTPTTSISSATPRPTSNLSKPALSAKGEGDRECYSAYDNY